MSSDSRASFMPVRSVAIWRATVASYADRAAAFLLPMLVLRGNQQSEAYAAVEFVISLSVMLATFFDAGLRNYVLYYERESAGAGNATLRTLQAYVPVYAVQLGVVALAALPWLGGFNNGYTSALVFVGVARGAALSVIAIATQLLILNGRPASGALLSFTSWIFGALSFLVPAEKGVAARTLVFFSASFLILGAAGVVLHRRVGLGNGAVGRKHLLAALRWGWPLLVAAAASMAVAHFARIYAYAKLPLAEMVGFTFWLRVFSIIQLSHSALVASFSLEIFQSRAPGVGWHNLRRYLSYMAAPVAVALLVALFGQTITAAPPLPLSAVLAIFSYVLVWCLSAYLEIYVTRTSRTRRVMLGTLLAGVTFALLLELAAPSSPLLLAVYMTGSALIHLAILCLSLRKGE